MRKRGVLQLLRFHFWIALDICNSLFFYVVSANKQIAWIKELQFTVYTVQLITTQLQLHQNNSFNYYAIP